MAGDFLFTDRSVICRKPQSVFLKLATVQSTWQVSELRTLPYHGRVNIRVGLFWTPSLARANTVVRTLSADRPSMDSSVTRSSTAMFIFYCVLILSLVDKLRTNYKLYIFWKQMSSTTSAYYWSIVGLSFALLDSIYL